MRPLLALLLVHALILAAAPVASADAFVGCETDPPARCSAGTGTEVDTPLGLRGNYTLNVDARDNGVPQITIDEQGMNVAAITSDEQGMDLAITIDEQGMAASGSVHCDTSGDAPQCFPVWASLTDIPTAGFVSTGLDGKGASAGVVLFAQGSVMGCFIRAPMPGTGQPSASCFP